MAKKSYDSNIAEKANSALAKKLFTLINDPNELKEYLGCSIQAINQYKMGTTFPKVENLIKIAKYYNVSLDWLVGLSEQPSVSVDDKFLTDEVGFTAAAVGRLWAYMQTPRRKKALSILLEQDEFGYILDDIAHCAEMGELESLFEQSFAMNGKKPDNYEKELIRYDRNIHKTAAIYSPQLKLAKICEHIIEESEKDGETNGK